MHNKHKVDVDLDQAARKVFIISEFIQNCDILSGGAVHLYFWSSLESALLPVWRFAGVRSVRNTNYNSNTIHVDRCRYVQESSNMSASRLLLSVSLLISLFSKAIGERA